MWEVRLSRVMRGNPGGAQGLLTHLWRDSSGPAASRELWRQRPRGASSDLHRHAGVSRQGTASSKDSALTCWAPVTAGGHRMVFAEGKTGSENKGFSRAAQGTVESQLVKSYQPSPLLCLGVTPKAEPGRIHLQGSGQSQGCFGCRRTSPSGKMRAPAQLSFKAANPPPLMAQRENPRLCCSGILVVSGHLWLNLGVFPLYLK